MGVFEEKINIKTEEYMNKRAMITCLVIILIGLYMIRCSSNRLREYEFNETTVSAIMATPPRAQIFSDFFYPGGEGLVGTAIRIGTGIVKGIQTHEAQERLDSAMTQVDIPEEIRKRTLEQSGKYLHFNPVEETENADFLMMMKIEKYGIEASSWDASVDFIIHLEVQLIDNVKHAEVWEKTIDEDMVITSSLFGLGDSFGDVITASALSELSEEEMVNGFTHLADYTADRMAEKIEKDFIKAHSEE